MRRVGRRAPWVLLWLVVAALLLFALRQVPLAEVAAVVGRLTRWQILALVGMNVLYLVIINLRWWLILRSLKRRLPLATIIAYRLAGFGVTYVTPGPQFGGEPLQVHLLHARSGVPLPEAVTSVFLDRVLDLMVNFTFLVFGCAVVLSSGILGRVGLAALALPLLLLLLPTMHLLALRLGRLPVTAVLQALLGRVRWRILLRAGEIARTSEMQIARMLHEQSQLMVALFGISLLAWLLAVVEFWMTLVFLGISAGFVDMISALTAARIAFLLPLPAGLGALEASQVMAAQALGWGAAVGIAVSLIIRARDVLLALVGLLIGGVAVRPVRVGKAQSEEGSVG